MKIRKVSGSLLLGVAIGVVYGVITRIVFGENLMSGSITFLCVVPAVLGIIPLLVSDAQLIRKHDVMFFIPWITVIVYFITLVGLGLEDFLCLLILSAPFFFAATLGAIIWRYIDKKNEKQRKNDKDFNAKKLGVLLIPFLLAPIEKSIEYPQMEFSVESEIFVNANSEEVWNNIVEVKSISENEYEAGFFNWAGIPRPIEAKVDKKALNGTRTGSFEGGLRFVETITNYDLYHQISFDIKVDPESVRDKVFDQHVLKGNYFTFKDATYELQEESKGTRLILRSRYTLRSRVNLYGKFWGNLILGDFQDRLLKLIKKRCEQ